MGNVIAHCSYTAVVQLRSQVCPKYDSDDGGEDIQSGPKASGSIVQENER